MTLPDDMIDKTIIKKKLIDLLPTMIQIFASEPAVLKINDEPIMIVGDIHGNLHALDILLEQRDAMGCKNILFLGDYVDRGLQGAEVLLTVFDLKVSDPEHVFLLRGNHEDAQMNVYYGFYYETGKDKDFTLNMHEIFCTMPIAAVLSNDIFCVHGGICGADSIDTITKDESFQYLWNDPSKKLGITHSHRGEGIKRFGRDIVDAFLDVNGLNRLVRAHECHEEGYMWWFDGKLLSLFSSTNYCGRINKGAFAVYKEKGLSLYVFDNKNKIQEYVQK